MHFRLPLMLAVGFLATPAVADSQYTQALESVLTMRIDGEVEVAGDGSVKSHTLATELPPEIRTPVEKAIASWRFAPPTVAGKPVAAARSKMRIALVARESGKDYVVKIENVTFAGPEATDDASEPGGVSIAKRKLPNFRTPVDALVTLLLHVDADGKLLDVVPTQCTVVAIAPGQNGVNACKTLERTGVAAVRGWTFKVAPGGDGKPTTAALAFWFTMTRSPADMSPGKWRREQRSEYRAAPWENAPRVGTADIAEGGLVHPYAGLKLEEGIGKTL